METLRNWDTSRHNRTRKYVNQYMFFLREKRWNRKVFVVYLREKPVTRGCREVDWEKERKKQRRTFLRRGSLEFQLRENGFLHYDSVRFDCHYRAEALLNVEGKEEDYHRWWFRFFVSWACCSMKRFIHWSDQQTLRLSDRVTLINSKMHLAHYNGREILEK